MNTHTPRPPRLNAPRLAAAFSLIEVLIAILILALGLLGLGAVIPVVVREQRIASESTRAVIAANNAKAYLRARPDLNRLVGDGTGSRGASGSPGSSPVEMGFGVWLEDDGWSRGPEYLWQLPSGAYDLSSGAIRFRDGGGPEVVIRVADRLWPDASAGAQPQLVWDIVGRRVGPDDPRSDANQRTVQLAVFVRRIDPGIRVPPGKTRREMLLANPGDPHFRIPVSADRSTGRPRGDGLATGDGGYSAPRILDGIQVVAPNVLEGDETGSADDLWSRPGQVLVDNLGNIYRVLRQDPDNPSRVVIDPPVTDINMNRVTQVVYTPQVPAAVEVFQITVPFDPPTSPNGAGAGMSPWFGQVGRTP